MTAQHHNTTRNLYSLQVDQEGLRRLGASVLMVEVLHTVNCISDCFSA